ncbi:MAG: ParB/RepB/Spo0J family partition protein [Microthrixaceae bacterium]|nr:ParB/RepB/Spo0J family partition protein [Microthrixaceae bacterium]
MTTLAHVPLAQIHTHPSNPRFDAVADSDMVASVEAQGILTPVTLAPALDGDGYVLIGGHRRLDAATKAGLTQLPAIIRDDLMEAQQVEAMLVENLHRVDLTPVEEAQAYEQLTLFGMDVAAIAEATGRSASTVKSRLKLNGLPDGAKAKVHAGDATLLDAEALLEFTDSPEVLAELEASFGSDNFAWRVRHARDNAARAARNAQELEELLAAGAVKVEPVTDPQDRSRTGKQWPLYSFTERHLQQRDAHEGCLGVVVFDSSFEPHRLVCTNPAGHPVDDTAPAAGTSPASYVENDLGREERLAAAAAREAAEKVRVEWLTDHYAGALPAPAKAKPLVAALRAALPPILVLNEEMIPWTNLGPVLGVDDPAISWHDRTRQVTEAATELTVATADTVLRTLAAVVAVLTNEALLTTDWTDDVVLADRQVDLWEWLTAAGYTLSDADKEVAATVTGTRDRLAGNTDEEAS